MATVTMTGVNRRYQDDPASEFVYGIAPSTAANDSKCMGAYLGVLEASEPAGQDNPHLVMAVGNGDMWVVDSGGDIEPGDYLLSSDVLGCAMNDDPDKFPIGYIVARAAEGIEWASVESSGDAAKRTKISVFYESFVRNSEASRFADIIESQEREIESLRAQVESLQSIEDRLAQLEAREELVSQAADLQEGGAQ